MFVEARFEVAMLVSILDVEARIKTFEFRVPVSKPNFVPSFTTDKRAVGRVARNPTYEATRQKELSTTLQDG